jgi:hypothetical protein
MSCSVEANQKATDVSERKPKKWNKNQRSLIEKFTEDKHLKLRQVAKRRETGELQQLATNSQRLAEVEEKLVAAAGDIISLKPEEYDKLASLLSATLGWRKKNPLNPSLRYSQAGEVKAALSDARRVAQNMVEDASHIRMLDGVRNFDNLYKQVLKPHKISADDARALFNETLEVGSIPKNNTVYGNSEGVRLVNELRYNDYIERAKDLGLTDGDIAKLTAAASDVHAVFDDMRTIAEATGHNIEELTNLGYFPRIATRDFNLRLRELLNKDTALADVVMSDGVASVAQLNPLGSAWQKSRKFNYTVPSDFDVVAQLFDTTSDDIKNLLTDPKDWMEFLSTKASASQLDELVELGMMDKLPMTSKEVFDFMVDQYELPYKHLNEMFKLDPQQASKEYARILKQATGNSMMVQTVVKEGVAAGWALTTKQLADLTPEARNNFVPFAFQNLSEFFDNDQQIMETMKGFHVHRVVSDQWKAILEVSSSPAKMGNIAKAWHHFATFMNKSALASRNFLYVGTNFLSGAVQTLALGANIATVPHAMFDIAKYMDAGIDAFDNTKEFAKIDGKWLTKREFFNQFLLKRGSDIAPSSVGSGTYSDIGVLSSFKNISSLFDVKAAKRSMEYMFNYTKAFGIGAAPKYIGSLVNEATDNFFQPFANMAGFLDTMYKWNAYTSLVERKGAAQVANNAGRVFTLEPVSNWNRTFGTFEELTRHVDDYLYTFDDPGTATSLISRYVRPFASWSMQAFPATMRAMVRTPGKFMAYNRLLQMYNRRDDAEETPQAGLTDWQDDEYPITLRRDVMNGGGLLTLFPHTFDPVTDALNTIDGAGKNISRAFGVKHTGNQRDDRKFATGEKDGFTSVINELFNETYYAKFASLATGVDSFTGQKLDGSRENSYLGVNVHPLAEALFSMYAPLDALDRANPADAFGRKEYRDYRGNVVVPEKPSWAGAARTSSDANVLATEKAIDAAKTNGDWTPIIAVALGARVRLIDTARNTQMTLDEIKFGEEKMTKANQKLMLSLKTDGHKLSEGELKRRTTRLVNNLSAAYQLRYDWMRLSRYMQQKKIPPNSLMYQQKMRSIDIDSLPDIGNKELLQLEAEFRTNLNSIINNNTEN